MTEHRKFLKSVTLFLLFFVYSNEEDKKKSKK